MNRIKSLRKKAGLSQAELADKLSVHQTLISQIERETVTPSGPILLDIANFFGVSMDYLIGRNDSPDEDVYRVPVLGRVAAGIPLFAAEEIIDWEELPKIWKHKGDYYGLQIQGNSMEPRMCDGDVVIVRQQETCESGQTAIVMVNGDEATCKRVVFHENGLTLVQAHRRVFHPWRGRPDEPLLRANRAELMERRGENHPAVV